MENERLICSQIDGYNKNSVNDLLWTKELSIFYGGRKFMV